MPQPVPGEGQPRVRFTYGTFSPDGGLLAYGIRVDRPVSRFDRFNLDRRPPDPERVRVWQVASGRELPQFRACQGGALHGRTESMQFSPDGKSLAIAMDVSPRREGNGSSCVASVVEVASGLPRRTFAGHTDHVLSVAFSPDGKVLATGSQDSTVLLWTMQRPFHEERPGVGPAGRLTLCWGRLAGDDAADAYDAVLDLAARPEESLPFLADRLEPVALPSNQQVAKWIGGLDDGSPAVRAESAANLAALHELARPDLERALKPRTSAGSRRRIGELLTLLDSGSHPPQLLRLLRTVEVLERIASPRSRRLLEVLAAGAPGHVLTFEARASLARLERSQ
jgi:hypothetical protein